MSAARSALVTGSRGGIGAAIVRRLSDAGLAVAGVDIVAPTGAGAALGSTCELTADVAHREDVARVVEAARARIGPIDVLVNCAGMGGPFHRIDEVEPEEWDRIMAVNVRGPWLLCRELIPAMARRGFGRVINVASILGLRGAARSTTYAASKHALVGLTRALALEWGSSGVTVNAVCPGYVATAMGLRPEVDPGAAAMLERIPAGRQADPEEIAAAVEYLAGTGSGYVNGAVLVVDGGLTAG